jgi:hypothetical protein
MGALATTLQSSSNNNESPCEDKQQVPHSDPPFFRFPGELRNRVYEYALTTDKTLRFIGANSGEKPKLLEPDSRHANGEYNSSSTHVANRTKRPRDWKRSSTR